METTVKDFVKKLNDLEKKFGQDKLVKEFEESSERFEELVEKGLIVKRGNNLLSVTDAHIKNQVWFNA